MSLNFDLYGAHFLWFFPFLYKYRTKYQGVKPPVKRSSTDFDLLLNTIFRLEPHTSGTREEASLAYQSRKLTEYQFHEALCDAAGHTGPLHKCDIYQSTEAGTKLGDMLKLGSSRPWPEALEAITGSRDMSAEPLIEFFKPLIDWLEVQNEMNGDVVGWEDVRLTFWEHLDALMILRLFTYCPVPPLTSIPYSPPPTLPHTLPSSLLLSTLSPHLLSHLLPSIPLIPYLPSSSSPFLLPSPLLSLPPLPSSPLFVPKENKAYFIFLFSPTDNPGSAVSYGGSWIVLLLCTLLALFN
ncbi:hypothetical protein BSL78_14266 [Apostichopus japonicus]|uniref:Angiotensin-converting enzyme n=1 Tax=Stichopus japonicus TaxID=307972 RepID=A0A2G8KLG8_STIJA|nr:hypothetical protein BSL78_14266 [Apostichopus japonicus]